MTKCGLLLTWLFFVPAILNAESLWWQVLPGDEGYGYQAVCETPFGWASVGRHTETMSDSVVRVSEDGESWRQVHREAAMNLIDIAWGAPGGVCAGSGGILFSENGVRWEKALVPSGAFVQKVEWAGGRFIALGFGGAIFVSSDGRTWVQDTFTYPGTAEGVVERNGAAVIFGTASSLYVSDGSGGWSQVAPPANYSFRAGTEFGGGALFSAYGLFDDAGSERNGEGVVLWAADGSWTRGNLYSNWRIDNISSGSGGALAIGRTGSTYWSEDGLSWQLRSESGIRDPITNVSSVASSGEQWLIGTSRGGLAVGAASDTLRFDEVKSPVGDFSSSRLYGMFSITRFNGKYYAFGHYGLVMSSVDGVSWYHEIEFTSSYLWRDQVVAGSELIVVGNRGKVLRIKTDGTMANTTNIGTTAIDLHGVAGNAAALVAIGSGGAVYRSLNGGVNWSAATSISSAGLRSITTLDGNFYCVSEEGNVYKSSNGSSWQKVVTGNGTALHRISLTSVGLVAVGEEGLILRSADGQNWQSATNPSAADLYAVFEHDGKLFAGGRAGSLVESADGISWSQVAGQVWRQYDIRCVYSDGGKVLGACSNLTLDQSPNLSNSSGCLLVSTTAPEFGIVHAGAVDYRFLRYHNGEWWRGSDKWIERSPNGEEWTKFPTRTTWSAMDVAFDGTRTVIGGVGGLLYSGGNDVWQPAVIEPYQQNQYSVTSAQTEIHRIATSGTRWFACGPNKTRLVSEDGLNWRVSLDPGGVLPTSFSTVPSVAWGDGKFVMVEGLRAFVSPDGDQWTEVTFPAKKSVSRVVWDGSWFFAGFIYNYPEGYLCYRSADGVVWEEMSAPSNMSGATMRAVDGRCYGLGADESVWSTEDGSEWHCHAASRNSPTTVETPSGSVVSVKFGFTGLATDGVKWLAVGKAGSVSESTDTEQWTHSAMGEHPSFNRLRVAGNRFYAMGGSLGALSSSVDGISWTRHNIGHETTAVVSDVAAGGSLVVAVGGSVFVSTDYESFQTYATPGGATMTGVAYHAGAFFAGDSGGKLWRSIDGLTWAVVAEDIYGFGTVESNGTEIIAFAGSNLWRSQTGLEFTKTSNVINGSPSELVWAGRWVTTTGTNIWTSTDPVAWEFYTRRPIVGNGLPIIATGPLVVGVEGDESVIRSSTDYGSDLAMGLGFEAQGVVSKGGTTVAINRSGALLVGISSGSPAFARMQLANGVFPSEVSELDADVDGDGRPDSLEEYLGVSGSSQSDPLLNLFSGGEGMHIGIPKSPDIPFFLRLELQVSDDLVRWDPLATKQGGAGWNTTVPTDDSGILDWFGPLPRDPAATAEFWRLKLSEN